MIVIKEKSLRKAGVFNAYFNNHRKYRTFNALDGGRVKRWDIQQTYILDNKVNNSN